LEKSATLNEVLESIDKLPLDDQEVVLELVHKRLIQLRRKALKKEIQQARKEFRDGKCKIVTPSELMKEIEP